MAQPLPFPNGIPSNAQQPLPPTGGNRKKQKRRAKQQAKLNSGSDDPSSDHHDHSREPPSLPEALSDDEDDLYPSHQSQTNGVHSYASNDDSVEPVPKKRNNKKKKRASSHHSPSPYPDHARPAMHSLPLPQPPPRPMPSGPLRSAQRPSRQDRIWNTSTQEERERIKEFWLTLSEEERKSLLKIEKEAVLRKMKEQQKHSCSCTVCGRKRVAIEEELEVLYDAYYEELEQYAHHQGGEPGHGMLPPPRSLPPPHTHRSSAVPLPLSTHNPHHRTSRVHEVIDEPEDDDDDDDDREDDDSLSEEEEEEYSDEDDLYSDEEDDQEDDVPRGIGADFFNFGNSLTVKGMLDVPLICRVQVAEVIAGGILTVADDLLKNDGKKFIEMMEQLAERRMQREQDAEYASAQPAHTYTSNGHDPPLDDEEYEDEEDDYDSQDEYEEDEEEEDEMVTRDNSWEVVTCVTDKVIQGGMTEEQRMEEGRRMFQIFAARMFEQRVLTAYREKVAAERQKRLLEELEDESKQQAEQAAKKLKDAEKRKNKKLAQKQAKAEAQAKKDAEKAAEEAAARAVEEKKQEEARQRKEEQRKKKEAERKAQEEDKQRKEAERVKRQQEERERQQEAERKKALEKKQREEARLKERDEREAREKEAKEKKAQAERERKEREAKAKADKEARMAKRPSQVAIPPSLLSKQSSSSASSPQVSVATPASSKQVQPRQNSFHATHQPSPVLTQTSAMLPTKSTSPGNAPPPQSMPRSILQKSHTHYAQPPSPATQLPPPGMQTPQHQNNGFNGFPTTMAPFPGFHTPHAPMMHHRPSLPGFAHGPFGSGPFQPMHPTNSVSVPPTAMSGLGMMAQSRAFPLESPPAFTQQMPPVISPTAPPGFGLARHSIASHSRKHSSETSSLDAISSPAPISRPTPIQRPSTMRPHNSDVDDLSKHLGSSALLDGADDPLPAVPEGRRASAITGPRASGPTGFGSPVFGHSQPRMDVFGANSSWTSPSLFGAPPGISASSSSWGANVNSGWSPTPFGNLGHRPSGPNRPLTIRLAVCNACKQLAAREPTPDNYYSVESLLRQIEVNRVVLDSPISIREVEEICETEGDSQNGGGLLHARRDASALGGLAVKFEPDGRPPHSLGPISSPIPGRSIPATGFGGSQTPMGRGSGYQSFGSAMATSGHS
jgi:hypothetical protein